MGEIGQSDTIQIKMTKRTNFTQNAKKQETRMLKAGLDPNILKICQYILYSRC